MARTLWTEAGPIMTTERVSPEYVEQARAATAASAADPLPLGMAAFGLTIFLLGIIYGAFAHPVLTSWLVIPVAFWFGGLIQFLASMWAMRKGNTLAATAMGVLSGFCFTWAVLQYYAPLGPIRPGVTTAAAIYLGLFGIITLYLCAAALQVNAALAAVLGLATCTFWAASVGVGIGSMLSLRIGGWFGVATGIVAFYASFAHVMASASGRELLPIGSRPNGVYSEGMGGPGLAAPGGFRDQFVTRGMPAGASPLVPGVAGAKGGEAGSSVIEEQTIRSSVRPADDPEVEGPAR